MFDSFTYNIIYVYVVHLSCISFGNGPFREERGPNFSFAKRASGRYRASPEGHGSVDQRLAHKTHQSHARLCWSGFRNRDYRR